MNTELLIDAIVQQTMVFVARLATAGGTRAPLAHVADKVFAELTKELQQQGVSKRVIADMFGMALRSYHRKSREVEQCGTNPGRTVWEAVLEFVRAHEPVSGAEIYNRFRNDEREVVAGVLNDLVESSLAYRAGRGDNAVYRIADQSDFVTADPRAENARQHMVWLAVYRGGPISLPDLATALRLSETTCASALQALVAQGKVTRDGFCYRSDRFEVPVGESQGWEAAVLDHYQAMVNAIAAKVCSGAQGSRPGETVGGATFSFDIPEGHPLEAQVLSLLSSTRKSLENLRDQVDRINHTLPTPEPDAEARRLIFYLGQYVKS